MGGWIELQLAGLRVMLITGVDEADVAEALALQEPSRSRTTTV